jgi:putative transposase
MEDAAKRKSMVPVQHECHRRFQQWAVSKVFQKLWVILLELYDDLRGIKWIWQLLDSVCVKAPLGGT